MKSYGSPEPDSITSVVTPFESHDCFEQSWVSFSATQWSVSAAVILLMVLLTYEMQSAPMQLLPTVSAGLTSPIMVKSASRSATAPARSHRVGSRAPSESAPYSRSLNSVSIETAIVDIAVEEFLLPSGELSEAGTARLKILANRMHQGDLRIEFLSMKDSDVSASVRMADYLLRSCRVPAETLAFAAVPVRSQTDTDSGDENSARTADHRDSTGADGDIQLRMTRLIRSEDPESFESISKPVKALR